MHGLVLVMLVVVTTVDYLTRPDLVGARRMASQRGRLPAGAAKHVGAGWCCRSWGEASIP